MPVPVKTLRVLPNPWVHNTLDHRGRPAGRCAVDPHEHSPHPATFVGAKFVNVVEEVPAQSISIGKTVIQTAFARHDHRIAYSREPVDIPNTSYYRAAIACGDLVAADAKTASLAGIKFVPPEQVLEEARAREIAHFNASTGDDAHAEIQQLFKHDGEPLYLPTAEEAEKAAKEASAKVQQASAPAAPDEAETTDSKGSV